MATGKDFMDYVQDQVALGARLRYKKMFGEYGIYVDDRFVAMACDNSLFLKPTTAVSRGAPELPLRPPYPGAREHPVADELLDEPERLRALLIASAAELPAPKPKRARPAADAKKATARKRRK